MAEVSGRPNADGMSNEPQDNRYDDAVEDFWRDLDIDHTESAADAMNAGIQPAKDFDKEIKITKKRKPIAKLDAERLLSERGIPELRRRAKKRIKLRGKGNEFEDIGNLLQMYQMWLDDLFPKAKFRDGLSIIEKVGHSKRLNVMRKAWITSTRAMQSREEAIEAETEVQIARNEDPSGGVTSNGQQTSTVSNNIEPEQESELQQPDEDELDALLAGERSQITKPKAPMPFADDDSDSDELDALLAQESAFIKAPAEPAQQPPNESRHADPDRFADEEEVLHELGDW